MKRWDMNCEDLGGDCSMQEFPDGKYVLYADAMEQIERLQAEIVRLKAYADESYDEGRNATSDD